MNFFNQYQYDDLLQRHADPYANAKYRIIMGRLRREKPLRILNAGCGSGELSFLLAEAGHTVIGIDPAPEYIELANRFAESHGVKGCSFYVSTIEAFDAGEGYDAVIATDVLEHIADDTTAAKKLIKLLKPEGLLVITVPALQWLFGFHDEQIGHFRRYSRGRLKKLLTTSGPVLVERARYFGWTLIPVCLLWSKILRHPYRMALADNASSFVGQVLRALLYLDTRIPLPFGTSLILFGKKIR